MISDLERLFTVASKLGGLAVGALGVNTGSIKEMTVGSAVAVLVHLWDSAFNSPKGSHPTL